MPFSTLTWIQWSASRNISGLSEILLVTPSPFLPTPQSAQKLLARLEQKGKWLGIRLTVQVSGVWKCFGGSEPFNCKVWRDDSDFQNYLKIKLWRMALASDFITQLWVQNNMAAITKKREARVLSWPPHNIKNDCKNMNYRGRRNSDKATPHDRAEYSPGDISSGWTTKIKWVLRNGKINHLKRGKLGEIEFLQKKVGKL